MKSSKNTLLSAFSVWKLPYLRMVYKLIVYSPVIWLTVFGLFILAVTVQVGHLPTYGVPDPKYAGLSSLLYMPTILLLVWVVSLTPVGLALSIVRLWKGIPKSVRWEEIVFYLVGLGLFYMFILNDIAGLMTWLGD